MGYNISINEDLANQMTSQEMATYYTLKRFMNHKTKQCFPSISTLSKLLKWAENTTRKWLRSLEKKGFIKIKKRYKTVDGKRQNFSNLYTFFYEGVLQKNKKATSKSDDEHITNEQNDMIDINTIKLDLIEKYGQEIVDKALIQMKIAIDKGTNVYNLKGYLNKVCSRLQAQYNMTKGISQVNKDKTLKSPSTQKKSPQSKRNGWGSSNISRVSDKYSNNDLESIIQKKLKHRKFN